MENFIVDKLYLCSCRIQKIVISEFIKPWNTTCVTSMAKQDHVFHLAKSICLVQIKAKVCVYSQGIKSVRIMI